MNIFRDKKFYLVFIFIVLGAYGILNFISWRKVYLTDNFINSRMQTALIAGDIINLSNQVKDNLFKINSFDQEQKYKEAFNLLNETNLKILDISQKAVELSRELEIMTKELNNIKANGGEIYALSAITTRLAIINHLINYRDYLFQLNLALQDRFYGKNNRETIIDLINKINREVDAINNANNQANIEMEKFDNALK
ncbi:MAG: hypothetical protein NZ484_00140 [Patescibacteria group bacterium]|nr:hypothetical protein [Patescibacteria group bacterium]MDW8279589.1 hypothetical protein [bacterium]